MIIRAPAHSTRRIGSSASSEALTTATSTSDIIRMPTRAGGSRPAAQKIPNSPGSSSTQLNRPSMPAPSSQAPAGGMGTR